MLTGFVENGNDFGSPYELLENGINVGTFPKNTTNILCFAGHRAIQNVPNSLLFGIEPKNYSPS